MYAGLGRLSQLVGFKGNNRCIVMLKKEKRKKIYIIIFNKLTKEFIKYYEATVIKES